MDKKTAVTRLTKAVENATNKQLIFSWKYLTKKDIYGAKLFVEIELADRGLLDYNERYEAYLK